MEVGNLRFDIENGFLLIVGHPYGIREKVTSQQLRDLGIWCATEANKLWRIERAERQMFDPTTYTLKNEEEN